VCGVGHELFAEGSVISLSDNQLSVVMSAAAGLDVEKRDAFLQRVAALLRRQAGRIKSDDDVGRAVAISQSSLGR
jgi:hypothetical protein